METSAAEHASPHSATAIPRARGHPLRLALVGTVIAAAAIYGALSALAIGQPPTQMEVLRLLPEADLLYPGSEVISRGGNDERWMWGGTLTAVTWQYVGVNASPAEIEAWYEAELTSRGWVDGGGSSAIPTTNELWVRAWERNGITFRLGVRDPHGARARPEQFERYETVYDVRLRSQD